MQTLPTPHSKLLIARVRTPLDARLLEDLCRWLEERRETDAEAVRARLRRWVPEYSAPQAPETLATAVRR